MSDSGRTLGDSYAEHPDQTRVREAIRKLEAGATAPPPVAPPPVQPPTKAGTGEPANSRQVGGSHYRDAAHRGGVEQHWDRMWKLYREAWFVGNITKYVERYRDKDGLKDLQKALHYLDKLIELETEDAKNKEPDDGRIAVRGNV